jgi:cytochrome c2
MSAKKNHVYKKLQMIRKSFLIKYLLVLFLGLTCHVVYAASADEGKVLFKQYCAQCHNKNMKDKLTGPALGGVEERWESQELLYAWIRNSQEVIASGDPYAVALYNEYNKSVMNPFVFLTDDEIASMLLYIDGMYTGTYGPKPAGGGEVAGTGVAAEKTNNNFLYITLFVILGLLALVLARITANLNYLAKVKEGDPPATKGTLADILTSKGMIGFLVFALVVFAGYTTINNAIELNRQQNYAPDQPIKFSHALHAGQQKIDCQYCHDGARRSKHSVIPAANTCMNCHKAIKKGGNYGTAEISKIYASIGYNPNTDTYIEDPENMPQDSFKAVFTKWIGNNFKADNDLSEDEELPIAGKELVDEQWDGIVSSLTSETKESVYGPIPWVRIHNLPDHVYFSHKQHVTVGKLECQECHGKVEEMEVVYQHSPLSMGWCINCHRQTEVKFADNEYYQAYEKYHEQMRAGDRDKVTVEDIGGLECQKCHY